ncbi:MAG: V-type ATP synthase subunit E [Anaerolineae bacterium]
MALEDILRAMEAEAQGEVERLEAEAEAAAREILAEAEAEAKAIKERHLAKVLPSLRAEQARLLHEAKLAALREVVNAREGLIARAFALAEERLSQICAQDDYPRFLRRLTEEVVAELGDNLLVKVTSRDVPLMSQILADMGVRGTVQAGLNSLGGLEASTSDGRISLSNTLESRLKRARQLLRREIAALVWGEMESEERDFSAAR